MRILDVVGRPGCLVLFGGIAGYVVNGFWGLLAGLAIGYLLALLLGGLVGLVWGGAIPRPVRQAIAKEFLAQNPDLARRKFPGQTDQQVLDQIARSVNELFHKSMADNARQGEYSVSRQNVEWAYQEIRDEQTDEVSGQYWDELWTLTELLSYPAEND